MLQLLALNKGKGQKFKAEQNGDTCTLYIYDVIVSDELWGGVGAQTFVKAINEITAPIIHLRIQSPGGDVFAAKAMAQAIKEHKSTVIAHVDGMAASAATFLVTAADQSLISEGGMFMIHNAWTFASGNASELIKTADLLTKIDATLVTDYAKQTGKSEDEIKTWMDQETYFFGQEAVDQGFIDTVAVGDGVANKIDFDLSAYKNEKVPDQPQPKPKKEKIKPDLSAHYRQLQFIELTA